MKAKAYSLDGLIQVDFKNMTKPSSSKSFNKVLFVCKEDEVGAKWEATDRVKTYKNWDDFKADKFDESGYVYKIVQKAFNQEKIGKLSIGRIFATDGQNVISSDGEETSTSVTPSSSDLVATEVVDEKEASLKASNPIIATLDALDEAMQGNFYMFTTSYAISDISDMEAIQEWAEKTDHQFFKALNDTSLTEKGDKDSFVEKRKLMQYGQSAFIYDENIEQNGSDLIFCLTWGATLDLNLPGKDEPEKTDGFNDFVGILPTELSSTQITNLLNNRIGYITSQNNKVFTRNLVNAREHAYSKDLDMFLGQDIFFTFVLKWLKINDQERVFDYHMSRGRKNMDNKSIASVRGILKGTISDAIAYKLLLSNGDSIQIGGVQVNVKNDVVSFSQSDLTQNQRQSGEMGRFEKNVYIPNGIRKYILGINYSS